MYDDTRLAVKTSYSSFASYRYMILSVLYELLIQGDKMCGSVAEGPPRTLQIVALLHHNDANVLMLLAIYQLHGYLTQVV